MRSHTRVIIIGMLSLVTAFWLPVGSADALSFTITDGSYGINANPDFLAAFSGPGFEARGCCYGFYSLTGPEPPRLEVSAPPGTVISYWFTTNDWDEGQFIVDGTSYSLGGFTSWSQIDLTITADPVPLPSSPPSGSITLRTMAELTGTVQLCADGELAPGPCLGGPYPGEKIPLFGRGLASLSFYDGGYPQFKNWFFSGIDIDFLPLPEPASLLLLGSGTAVLAAWRRKTFGMR